ncbi:PIG-L deacetylase family protein [Niallia sp. FSL K6-0212]|uniref:PIG-L deacetylase family protein n=1 Tax=Niallia sp. FSL K6-0212 TaxID=2921423 RepID=UPI0030FBA390
MNYLIVVAHPDDEVLGAGATICKLIEEGNVVNVCILSSQVVARKGRPSLEKLNQDIDRSLNILGVKNVIKGTFPNIQFNIVPHLELVQFIEDSIIKTKAETIFTHHPADLNNDHYHTSIACQAATRLFQRRTLDFTIKELLFMEIPSSTEWRLNSSLNQFNPNTFVLVGKERIDKKFEALAAYEDVIRDYPHPRSKEAIKGLALYRGGQSGMVYAEAFESVFRREL